MPPNITAVSRVPNSPQLNQDFYVVFGFSGSTFTGAYCSIASVISPILSTGGSYAAIYPAGSVPPGTYAIYGFAVAGTTGSFTNTKSITVSTSEIADIAKTLYTSILNNLGGSFASTLITTGWYPGEKPGGGIAAANAASTPKPVITVTRGPGTGASGNVDDTFRNHTFRAYVDTWVGGRYFGKGSKAALADLDAEVKRIVDSTRKAPSAKIRIWRIISSLPLDEITDNRRMFRTRHTVEAIWDETIS